MSTSEEDLTLAKRAAALKNSVPKKAQFPRDNGKAVEPSSSKHLSTATPKRRASKMSNGQGKESTRSRNSSAKRQRTAFDENGSGSKRKWETLVHSGVLFPPEYVAHGVKMLYDGKPVDLTPEQEEIATFFAVMKDTEYVGKPQFIKNFFEGFREALGPKHVIKEFEKCDFGPIHAWHLEEKARKATLSKEEKQKIKEEKEKLEAKFRTAVVDGVSEDVGNFRVEPPGLFRGRGEHPKMGKVKRRIYPDDITLNLGEKCPIPLHPYKNRTWKSIVHKHDVTWLAFWKDPVSPKDFKYVWLAATSSFKSESDIEKYEKARKLKDVIDKIRIEYTRKWDSDDMKDRQIGTALYFIDKLALRAGHDKDEDEADTVGCCNLKVSNVTLIPPNKIEFDFLGKDSIQYHNTVTVDPKVYKNVQLFKRKYQTGADKGGREDPQLFDALDAMVLNKVLKDLMVGLSAKVFRTYNASITLDGLLQENLNDLGDATKKKAEYDTANKQVAILCNHQRAVPKSHEGQMEKMSQKVEGMQETQKEMESELQKLKKSGARQDLIDRQATRVSKQEDKINAVKQQAALKEEMKSVALGTSKINYLDPRITVAWCKRNDVPIEKVFPKNLLSKFSWAMTVEPDFKF